MAHWAELDENNIVIRVVVGDNNEPDEGYQWIIENLGGRWIKTSYNNNFRKTYAAEGFKYDESLDIFIRPKPYESWIFDENSLDWQAPEPKPDTSDICYWDEDTKNWIVLPTIPDTGMWIFDEETRTWKEYDAIY